MHYLSILAILKNEAMNLRVWIDHYLWQGVEHIYLIDNGSDDDSVEIINDLITKGFPITLYQLPERHKQNQHIQYVYDQENLRQKTKWLIIADLDEFFYCHNSDMSTMLKDYEQYDYIASCWRWFGSNGLIQHPADIRVALTTRKEELTPTPKYIIQPKNIDSHYLSAHYVGGGYKNFTDLSNVFRLNHYVIQSKEFYEKVKMTRGDVGGPLGDNIRDWNYFNDSDAGTTFVDEDLKNMLI